MSSVCCSGPTKMDQTQEQKALKIIDILDSSSLNIFKQWNFEPRGQWARISEGKENYRCFLFNDKDTQRLEVIGPFGLNNLFNKDFLSNPNQFQHYFITKIEGKITIRSKNYNKNRKDTFLCKNAPTDSIFRKANPFKTIQQLTVLKDNLKVIAIFYISEYDFIEFYLTPNEILTYLPYDTSYFPVNSNWRNEFRKGKTIMPKWILRISERPLDQG